MESERRTNIIGAELDDSRLSDILSAPMTRLHNDTNMRPMGAGVVGENLAIEIADTWLTTPFSGEERHVRRLAKLKAMEE